MSVHEKYWVSSSFPIMTLLTLGSDVSIKDIYECFCENDIVSFSGV